MKLATKHLAPFLRGWLLGYQKKKRKEKNFFFRTNREPDCLSVKKMYKRVITTLPQHSDITWSCALKPEVELFNLNLKHQGLAYVPNEGFAPVPNVRIRGKIRHEEWPKIAARYHDGETLTEIARSYRCTAPAIRYIVKRVSSRSAKARKADGDQAGPGTAVSNRISSGVQGLARGSASSASELQRSGLLDRINSDIATYLTAMDALAAEDSDSDYEALLVATDQLLRATARTRLALESIIAGRKKVGQARRMTG